jgi:benzoate membrane transport protein
MSLEIPRSRPPSVRQVIADFDLHGINALIAFIFFATGPVAIILTVGTGGGLSPSDLSSWLFGAFFINGLVSIFFCWFYRQPLVLLFSIPGAVLVGPALTHLTFPEVIGAFIATGALMLALGLSGLVRRCMEAVPMPVVMGMVSGVLLRFGLDLVYALRDDIWVAAPMTGVFLAISAAPQLGRRLPPLFGASSRVWHDHHRPIEKGDGDQRAKSDFGEGHGLFLIVVLCGRISIVARRIAARCEVAHTSRFIAGEAGQ